MTKIIGITGRNRAGKTSLAKYIQLQQELLGKKVDYFPFAKPLKDELIDMGFSKWYLAEKSPKARRLLQAYGDARREITPSYFLDKWTSEVRKAVNAGIDVVISDDLYHWKELRELCKYSTIGAVEVHLVLVHRPTLPNLSEKDFEYDSVIEQQQIEEALTLASSSYSSRICKTGGPYGAKIRYSVVSNSYESVREFVAREAETILAAL